MDIRAVYFCALEVQVKSEIIIGNFVLRNRAAKKGTTFLAGLALLAVLGACSQAVQKIAAQEPTDDTACSLDGMVLKDYAGPKGQIHYAEGKPDFFCELTELFSVLLLPEQKRAVAAIYVQDMGEADWEHPQGHWIDAKTALYVLGSRKQGSMGATFGSFSRMQDAQAFVQKEGGRILHFEQITATMVDTRGSVASAMSHRIAY